MERKVRARVGRWPAVLVLVVGCASLVLVGCPHTTDPGGGGGDTPTYPDVTGLIAIPSSGQIVLEWTDPTEAGLTQIEIVWSPGGVVPVEVSPGVETYTFSPLVNRIEQTFTVTAYYSSTPSEGVVIASSPTDLPVADAARTPAGVVLVGEAVVFSGAGSSDPDGSVIRYSWDFGDGSATGEGETIVHAYSAAGSYDVELTVTDNLGATDTAFASVDVNVAPVAVITADTTSIETGQAVDFDSAASSDANGTITAWDWDFGDGGVDTVANPAAHTYAAAGVYVTTLIVTDDDGTTGSATEVISVNASGGGVRPVADLSASATSVSIGESIDFSASASTDSDGTVSSYGWTFGDGNTDAGVTTSHSYASSGTYTVGLLVTDNTGDTDTANVHISVNAPPTALITADTSGPTVGDTVNFTGSGSHDSDGTIVSYAWDFGDGETSTTADPSHLFDDVDLHVVSLTVTDDDGDTDTANVNITVGSLPPTAEAGPDQVVDVDDSFIVTLSGSGDDPDGSITGYSWAFLSLPQYSDLTTGDIVDATSEAASFDLSAEPFGSHVGDEWVYVLELTVTDDTGETATDHVTIDLVGSILVHVN